MAGKKESEFQMSEDTRRVIEDIFRSKDKSKSGVIDVDDFEECLLAVGFDPSEEDLDFLKRHFDDNGDGQLEIKELIANLDVINMHSLHGEELMQAFKKFDRHNKGFIRYPHLVEILTAPGPSQMEVKAARKLVEYLARNFDRNHDGKLSYAEFVRICMSDVPLLKFK